jgi:hypothetical protein
VLVLDNVLVVNRLLMGVVTTLMVDRLDVLVLNDALVMDRLVVAVGFFMVFVTVLIV